MAPDVEFVALNEPTVLALPRAVPVLELVVRRPVVFTEPPNNGSVIAPEEVKLMAPETAETGPLMVMSLALLVVSEIEPVPD